VEVGEGVFGEVEVGVDVCVEGEEPLVPRVRIFRLGGSGWIGLEGERLLGELVDTCSMFRSQHSSSARSETSLENAPKHISRLIVSHAKGRKGSEKY